MKKPTIITKKPASKAEQPAKVVATKTSPEKPIETVAAKASTEKLAKSTVVTKTAPKKKPVSAKKAQVVAPKAIAEIPVKTIPERIGLTAGSIWHYLEKNGATSVAKLLRELEEEEKIIQRSIGWLAQEGKITIDTTNRIEMITLKD
ncbi:hypothetical protein AU255_07960 [Methyloprofundus sedimenti]|uniref:Winged helix-turn-helix domain-containing protein n=1 Tax=Methyloprofundus sedimenti TaxID=1420851 RepID=A0A1V8M8B1_9GAMM|nr:winged helix-turn-helix domain-containing protein [Methyloprofundus sedimenti]OQK17785.1 hypothetical protein AU255_07960 [Methyloprofundus sedimenti]